MARDPQDFEDDRDADEQTDDEQDGPRAELDDALPLLGLHLGSIASAPDGSFPV